MTSTNVARSARLDERRTGATTFGKLVLASLLLGSIVPRFDDRGVPWLNSHMGEHAIVAFLAAVASGMMAFTGIVFSLLFVLLQFGSTAYSPRIFAIVAKPRTLGKAGGVFIGTFLYALMSLRGVGALPGGETSSLTIWVAFAWLLGCVAMLVKLVESVASLMQTNVLHLLGDTGQREIARMYRPLPDAPRAIVTSSRVPLAPAIQTVIHQGPTRYLLGLDVARLVALARETDAVIRVPSSTGDPIVSRALLVSVHGGASPIPVRALLDALRLGRDRTLDDDPKYALRLLVDIAVRALSPGLHEPTTAVVALDQIEGLLTTLGNSDLEVGEVRDADGALRLVHDATTWEDYLDLALVEIGRYGAGAPQVERRLAGLFAFLVEHVPAPRREPVERRATNWRETLRERVPGAALRAIAEQRDRQGLGHPQTADSVRLRPTTSPVERSS
ncbi:MAG TPA: DUF2254 domain-containing protein [Polyangiaceae bacterium]|nr:DUF2254 domain-containing protein [Polyangiaceae bacterium]